MILQALTNHYETLAAKGEIPRDGWALVKVSWALEIDTSGSVRSVMPLNETVERKGKTISIPQQKSMPAPYKRSSGIRPDFLCDNAAYILGVSESQEEKDRKRAADCFSSSREFHLSVLRSCGSDTALAVRRFFDRWDPANAAEHPVVGPKLKELTSGGGNITFYTGTGFAAEDAEIAGAWQDAYEEDSSEAACVCLVTGKCAVPDKIHPAVKGVKDA